jgi:MFS family permease
MKPIDDDESSSGETSDDSGGSVDAEEELKKRRRPHRRRSTGLEYASTLSFIAWIVFTIIWLFFFASDYSVFENIAIVFIALLIVGALNAVLWIPSVEGRRPKVSAVSGIGWIVFLIAWIIFFAAGFGFYENIGIALASLLVIGLLNMLIWVPRTGESGGARISGTGALAWLIFLVLWLPFADNFSASIYSITFYQSGAIVIASFLLMLVVTVAPWWGKMEVSIDRVPDMGRKPKTTLGMFLLWLLELVVWMWFFGDAYTGYQNASSVLISFAVFCGIIIGIWYSWTREREEGPESWFSIGLAFAWVITLALWFWFFADYFDMYQNIAVFIVSLLGVAGLGGAAQWQKWRDFEAMDWKD